MKEESLPSHLSVQIETRVKEREGRNEGKY